MPLCNRIWELGGFAYAFTSNKQRSSMHDQIKNVMKSHVKGNFYNAPWLLNKRLNVYASRPLVRILKFVQCCRCKKYVITYHCRMNGMHLKT